MSKRGPKNNNVKKIIKKTNISVPPTQIVINNGPPGQPANPKVAKPELGLRAIDLLSEDISVERNFHFVSFQGYLAGILKFQGAITFLTVILKIFGFLNKFLRTRENIVTDSLISYDRLMSSTFSWSFFKTLLGLIILPIANNMRFATTVRLIRQPDEDLGIANSIQRHEMNRMTDPTPKGFVTYRYQGYIEVVTTGVVSSVLSLLGYPTQRKFAVPDMFKTYFKNYVQENYIPQSDFVSVDYKREIVNLDLAHSIITTGVLNPMDRLETLMTKTRQLVAANNRVNLKVDELSDSSVDGTVSVVTKSLVNIRQDSTVYPDFQGLAGKETQNMGTGLLSCPPPINYPYQPVPRLTYSSKILVPLAIAVFTGNLYSSAFRYVWKVSQRPTLTSLIQWVPYLVSLNAQIREFLSWWTGAIP